MSPKDGRFVTMVRAAYQPHYGMLTCEEIQVKRRWLVVVKDIKSMETVAAKIGQEGGEKISIGLNKITFLGNTVTRDFVQMMHEQVEEVVER